jgi:hypothetical protein
MIFSRRERTLGEIDWGGHNIRSADKFRQENSALSGDVFGLFPHIRCAIISEPDKKERR